MCVNFPPYIQHDIDSFSVLKNEVLLTITVVGKRGTVAMLQSYPSKYNTTDRDRHTRGTAPNQTDKADTLTDRHTNTQIHTQMDTQAHITYQTDRQTHSH